MADLTQEEMLAAQKANCPFCKIVAGVIPSKKVYEDEQMLAILDINPANKGHVLVMPKEHYYILPLVPPEIFKHLFLQSRKLMHAMRKGLIVPRVTLFVANGGAAGQQSPHFLFHLIPREPGDGLDTLDVAGGVIPQTNAEAIAQNTRLIMRNLPVQPAPPIVQQRTALPSPAAHQPTAPSSPVARQPTFEQPASRIQPAQPDDFDNPPAPATPETPREKIHAIFELLKHEPALHKMLIETPEKVVEHVKRNPLLHKAFSGVDLKELGAQLRNQQEKNDAVPKPLEEVPHAKDLNDEELRFFVDTKPELKRLLTEDVHGLKKLMHHNDRLKFFFHKTSPEEVAERLRPKEPPPDETIDFDLLARHLSK